MGTLMVVQVSFISYKDRGLLWGVRKRVSH